MDLGLSGKVVVVTGAGSGIGLATARAFLEEGAVVVGGDLEPAAVEDLGAGATPVRVDLGSPDGPGRLVEAALAEHGRVDVLVNNVGIAPYRDGFLAVDDDGWRTVLDVNFMSAVRASRAVLPSMVERGSGCIVSIASDAGRQPDVFFVDYSVSKAALLMLSKTLANEFGPHGIRVNVVSPGPTRTPIWDRPGGFAESLAAQLGMEAESAVTHFAREIRKLPLGRLGRPQDVAAAVLFVASDRACQMTGSEVCIDGGVIRAA